MSNRKMVLYSAANPHGYFTSVLHRIIYNKDSFAIYVGDEGTVLRAGGSDIFDLVILYRQICGEWGNMNHLSAKEYEDYLIKHFDELLKKNNIIINEIDEVYTGSYWADFPIYLNIKKVKHNLFQEGSTSLGFPAEEYVAAKFPAQYDVQKKYGIYRKLDNPLIQKAYISSNNEIVEHNKIVDFNIAKAVTTLSDQDKSLMIDKFNIPSDLSTSQNNCLLLTQWFLRNGKIWDGLEPIEMFSTLIDFYLPNANSQVYIKPHPSDINRDNYSKMLNGVTVINHQFPSEFMAVIDNLHFNKIVTISSSSINAMKCYADEAISINKFDMIYSIVPLMYVAYSIIKQLKLEPYHFGIFNEYVLPMLKNFPDELPTDSRWYEIDTFKAIKNKSAILIYDLLWRQNQKNPSLSQLSNQPMDTIIFIITNNIEKFIQSADDIKYIQNIIPIGAKFININSNLDNDLTEKKLYAFVREPNCIKNIKKCEVNYYCSSRGALLQKFNYEDEYIADVRKTLTEKNRTKFFIYNGEVLKKKYRIILFANDSQIDKTICLLNEWIRTGQIEIIGCTSLSMMCFGKWNEYKFVPFEEVVNMDFDYIVACDYSFDCELKMEIVNAGIDYDKVIKGRILENPFFNFDKYVQVHNTINPVTIISSHCFGGLLYNDLDIKFNSPFINMFVDIMDFCKMVNDLEHYLAQPLKLYSFSNDERKYPIGIIDDIKLYFNHYKSWEEASNSWNRRIKRVNYSNILVQSPLYNANQLEQFSKIKYRKIGFSRVPTNQVDVIDLSNFYNEEYIYNKCNNHFLEYVLDFQKSLKRFPRYYDPYKLMLNEDYRI